jgi:hypothetical protein
VDAADVDVDKFEISNLKLKFQTTTDGRLALQLRKLNEN